MTTSRFLVLSICLFLCVSFVHAQVETARIMGTVSDPSGSVIPSAKIMIVHVQTNRTVSTITDEAGRYASVPLPVGSYRVEAEATGFKVAVRDGITLQVQQTAVVDLTLELGNVSERLVVTGEAPLLNTTEATQGQVIENKRIVDLPLNGRDYLQLALLSSGTAQDIGGRVGGFSAGGQRTSQNNFLLDGVDNNNSMQSAAQTPRSEAVKPSVDALQEFKVVTNSYSAEYGRAAGGVVNVVLKSGTNDFHGSAFGFLRNEVFDAKNFFDDPDEDKPPFKRSQFGGAFGGPILRDRTFFFGDYEGTRIRESRTVLATVPTLAMRTGDFAGRNTIYDPLTYNSANRTRQAFQNNRIPDARLDPVARQVAGWYPTPQFATRTANFLWNPPRHENVDKFDVRVDHSFGAADNIYYRFSYQRNFAPPSPNLPAPAYGGGLQGAQFKQDDGRNMALVWNHIFSPRLITATRLAWNSVLSGTRSPIDENYNATLGLQGVDQSLAGGALFVIQQYQQIGLGGFLPLNAGSQTRQLISDTSWITGKHVTKFGANFMWLQGYLSNPRTGVGQFTFNGAFTRNPANLAGGDPFADFLLGIPVDTRFATPVYSNIRAPWYSFYVNDEWKATSRLTLNLGLRYELRVSLRETRDRDSNYDIDTDPANPRLVVPGDSAGPPVILSKTNFAPRFGLAYRLGRGIAVRAGYGVFFGLTENPASLAGFNPPYLIDAQLTTDNINPNVLLRTGVPPGALTPASMQEVRLNSRERRMPTPYSQQWNFNIQTELASGWLWEVGYYGAKAQHLQKEMDANFVLPGPGSVASRRPRRTFQWPGTGEIVGLGAIQRGQNDANSLFHSLQTKIERRFVGGLSFLGSYMWSKTIGDAAGLSAAGAAPNATGPQDALNWRLERSLEDNHLAHRFVISPIWELPFGSRRKFGANWNPVARGILGGWTFTSILTITSGRPMSLSVQGDPANTGRINRPDIVGDPFLDRSERTLDRFFNTAAFARNQQFKYGNAGRNILIGPGLVNLDLAVYKNFSLSETRYVQFRAEAFNASNTPNFDAPNLVLGNPNFGKITAADRARNIQLGLKFVF